MDGHDPSDAAMLLDMVVSLTRRGQLRQHRHEQVSATTVEAGAD